MVRARFCTQALKVLTIDRYMKVLAATLGWDELGLYDRGDGQTSQGEVQPMKSGLAGETPSIARLRMPALLKADVLGLLGISNQFDLHLA
jgi:hypothetical protein